MLDTVPRRRVRAGSPPTRGGNTSSACMQLPGVISEECLSFPRCRCVATRHAIPVGTATISPYAAALKWVARINRGRCLLLISLHRNGLSGFNKEGRCAVKIAPLCFPRNAFPGLISFISARTCNFYRGRFIHLVPAPCSPDFPLNANG